MDDENDEHDVVLVIQELLEPAPQVMKLVEIYILD